MGFERGAVNVMADLINQLPSAGEPPAERFDETLIAPRNPWSAASAVSGKGGVLVGRKRTNTASASFDAVREARSAGSCGRAGVRKLLQGGQGHGNKRSNASAVSTTSAWDPCFSAA